MEGRTSDLRRMARKENPNRWAGCFGQTNFTIFFDLPFDNFD
jgi:hypothetical protein